MSVPSLIAGGVALGGGVRDPNRYPMQDKVWTPAFIAIGSNLDGPRERVEKGLAALAGIAETRVVAASPLYGSKPMGLPDQPDYVNAVAAILTRLEPEALMAALLAIELEQGRRRDGPKWGPRRIDLDLLLHGDTVLEGPGLILPHPGIGERPFVLQPLADLAPVLRLPDGRQVGDMLKGNDCSQLWKL